MTAMRRHALSASWPTFALLLLVGVFAWGGLMYREWPYDRQVNGVLEKSVRPGGTYHATVSVIRRESCPLRVHRTFWDGAGVRHGPYVVDVPGKHITGARHDYRVPYRAPVTAKPGKGRVCVALAPQCNFVQALTRPYLYRSCAAIEILPPANRGEHP